MTFPMKPDEQPRWATTAGPTDVIEPSSGKKDIGWFSPLANPEKPPYQTFNWLLLKNFEWSQYMEDFTDVLAAHININIPGDTIELFNTNSSVLLAAGGQLNIDNILGQVNVFESGTAIFQLFASAGAGHLELRDSLSAINIRLRADSKSIFTNGINIGNPSLAEPLCVGRDNNAGDSTNTVSLDVGNLSPSQGALRVQYTNAASGDSPIGALSFQPRNNAGNGDTNPANLIFTKITGSDEATISLANTNGGLFIKEDGNIGLTTTNPLTKLQINRANSQGDGTTQNNFDNLFITRSGFGVKGPSISFASPIDDLRSVTMQTIQTGGTTDIGLEIITRNSGVHNALTSTVKMFWDHENNLRTTGCDIIFGQDDRPEWEIEVIGGTAFKNTAIFRNTGFNGFKGISLRGFTGDSPYNMTGNDNEYSHLSILGGGLTVDQIVAYSTAASTPTAITAFVQTYADSGNLLKLKLPDNTDRTFVTSLDSDGSVVLNGSLTVTTGGMDITGNIDITGGELEIIDIQLQRVADTPNNYLSIQSGDLRIENGFNLRLFDIFLTRTASNIITVTPTNVNLEIEGGFLNTSGGLVWKQTILAIGVWNMDADISVNIAHGLTVTTIVDVSAIIYEDDLSSALRLQFSGNGDQLSGRIEVDATNAVLFRTAGGTFDGPLYNNTGVNRGYVVITHL